MSALRPASPSDANSLARLHAAAFDYPWSTAAIAATLGDPAAFGVAAKHQGVLAGFALARAAAGEAELLTIAVDPGARRTGLGARLLAAVLEGCALRGAAAIFLEVAVDNAAALALYGRAGFDIVGRRPRYYRTADGDMRDALMLRRGLDAVKETAAPA